MSTLTQPHTNGHERELSGVRTYRGRKLEDLIPQIRTELGPDAIILRQREGLMGGVGGFFAQKCVEVDAQAAPRTEAPRVDIYDEDEPVNGWELTDEEAHSFRTEPIAPLPDDFPALPAAEQPVAPPPVAADPVVSPTPEPEAFAAQAPQPFAAPAPQAFAASAPEAFAPPAPEAPPMEGAAESFVTRLEQAAAHVDIDELVKLVTAGGLPAPTEAPDAPIVAEPIVPEPPVVAEPLAPESVFPEPVAPEPIVAEAPVFET
ncbi:MAG TPA: hypothetical protein VHZ27_11215, partial [Solirubrobacteraceae bacterium]|nr:hypothetical protein [Solirubrobacteraceae bacterium]